MEMEIEALVSSNRYATYMKAIENALGEPCRALSLELYEWNAELSGKMLFPFHIYEVTLRNCIAEALRDRYSDNWPDNAAFVNSLKPILRGKFIRARDNYYAPIEGSEGKLLAELQLSIYESMLTSSQAPRLWIHKKAFEKIFPIAPATPVPENTTYEEHIRKLVIELQIGCKTIRKLRNRVAHHEPIFNKNDIYEVIPGVVKLLNWRNPTACSWFKKNELVSKVLEKPLI
ncbi:hypothetical protein [Idiomarina piscisalsi]|uniref:hypothetical protein n=1 Tax=Idiomarina piscisalsi TaxID=1096243 RepID=UPI00137D962B|nr:hypothetical protein [Idiomarina piscisalsi]MTJ02674.1 hypothetical protein [Idiomarina piscisalsi]